MNKRFSYLIVALLCLLGGQSAWADSWNSDDGKLTFTVIDEGQHHVSVSASSKSIEGEIVVPQTTTYEGETYTVTQVAAEGFYNVDGITSVTLPNSIEVIGNWAFGRSDLLASVNIPQNVWSIEHSAFQECPELKSIVIPSSVYQIGGNILYGTSLDYFTFEDGDTYNNPLNDQTISAKNVVLNRKSTVTFTDIETLAIGGGVEYVTDYIAYKATTLATVTIGGNVHTIGTSAFDGCTNLTTVNITTDKIRNINDYAFYNCQKLANFTIPAGTESLGKEVFEYCYALKDMVIPSSVMYIGSDVFQGCSFNNFTFEDGSTYGNPLNDQTVSAKNVVQNRNSTVKFTGIETLSIGGSVTSVADNIATNAKTLTSVTIGGNVTTIGASAFEGCTNLVSVNITANVEQIYNFAFFDCSSLSEITIPATVCSIGERAFKGCTSLRDVTIPASVTSVDNIFADAVMNSLTIEANGETLGNIGAFTATDVVMNRQTPVNFTATNLTIGGAITAIEDQQFKGKTIKTVTINSPVETIGVEAFEKCYTLTSITLPNTLTTIGNGAFYNCQKLEAITIPASVTSVGRAVFYDTPMLKDVVIEDGATILSINNDGGAYPYGADNAIESDLNNLYVGRNITMHTTADLVKSVKNITFGEGVTSITNLFKNNTAAENIHAPWATPITIAADEFSSAAKASATLWVPAGKKSTYEEATGWDFTTIQPTHYIVTLATEGNGTVTLDGKTEGDVLVAYDATNIDFVLAAGEDYDFTSLNDGTSNVYTPASQGATKNGGTYTLPSISDDMTFTATFTEKPKFTITATATGGTATPSAAQVYRDRDAFVTFAANEGHELTSVKLNDVEVIGQVAGNKLTMTNIQTNQNVVATFTLIHYTVSTAATENGTITLAATDVQWGNGTTATITPATGYDIDHVTINGVNADDKLSGNTLTISNVKANTVVGATFKKHAYTVSAAATTNGTIELASTSALYQEGTTATITPATGYDINEVTINGADAKSQLNGNTLTISNVTANTVVGATFKKHAYTISAAATTNGTIELASTSVLYQEGTTATLTPASGYMVETVTINGGENLKETAAFNKATGVLTISNVTADTEVSATFRIQSYTVTINDIDVTADNMYPQYGQNVTFTIANNPDRELTSFMVNGSERIGSRNGNTITVTANSDLNVVASFRSTVESISISDAGVGTYACTQDLDFTDSELKAYIAIGFNKKNGSVLLSRVYDVPAGTGLYLVADKGTYKIPYATSNSYYVNMLVGNTSAAITLQQETDNKGNYYLGVEGGTPKFLLSGGSATVDQNRAYLQIPTSFYPLIAGAKIRIEFEEDITTGIEDFIMLNQHTNDRIYNINGQQVNKMGTGIYIVNGKKVLKK